MARRGRTTAFVRGRRGSDSQNLDSLLDTMANVVGILIVLLAVVQMTVGDAMDRIRLFDSDEGRELAEEARALEQRLASLGPTAESEAERTRALREQLSALLADPDAARQRSSASSAATTAAAQAAEVRQLEQRNADKRRRLTSLQIRASDLEQEQAAGPLELRLPDPRPAPPDTDRVVVLIRHEHVLDPGLEELERQLAREVQSFIDAGHTFRGPDVLQFAELLRQRDIGNEWLRWQIYEESGQPTAHLEWRTPSAGGAHATLQNPGGAYQTALSQLDPKRHYLTFWVWGESFETYLEARRIAEKAGFAVGWRAFPEEKPLRFTLGPRRRSAAPVD